MIKNYQEVLSIYQKIGELDNEIRTMVIIGNLHIDNEHYENAKHLFEKTLQMKDFIAHVINFAINYNGLGIIYRVENNY